jgi:hypothetical protein
MRFGTGGVAAGVVSGAAGLASAMLADMIRFRVPDDLSLPQVSGTTECPNINYERKRGQSPAECSFWISLRPGIPPRLCVNFMPLQKLISRKGAKQSLRRKADRQLQCVPFDHAILAL